jgi:hypothetical protein
VAKRAPLFPFALSSSGLRVFRIIKNCFPVSNRQQTPLKFQSDLRMMMFVEDFICKEVREGGKQSKGSRYEVIASEISEEEIEYVVR